MKRALVWFTSDLRWHDNQALFEAITENEEILFCYCWNETFMNSEQLASRRVGNHRKRYLIQALIQLKKTLHEKGGKLLVLKGNPGSVLGEIHQQFDFQRVYLQQPIGWEELQELEDVKNQFQKEQIKWFICRTNTLVDDSELPFSIQQLPRVFTDFRKQVEKTSQVKPEIEMPFEIQSPSSFVFENELSFDAFSNEKELHPHSLVPYTGGENEVISHLFYYLFETKAIHTYKETRNELKGVLNSSKLSIGLATGCISARVIYHTLQQFTNKHGSNESTYWLYFELLWRDFFYFQFRKYPRAFFLQNGLNRTNTSSFSSDLEKLVLWKNGDTKNQLINAGMKELNCTGFTTNRMRQLLASYFIYDLQLDWRYGAAYFEEQLIDYDVANNWGNWAYIAGVGNDPRSGRPFNIEKQAEMYDKDHSYRALWNY